MGDYVGSKRTPVNAQVEAAGCTWIIALILVSALVGIAASLQRIAYALEAANQTTKEAADGR